MSTTITTRLADALRALLTDYRIQNDLRDDAAATAAHEALADYDNRKPEPPSLADALRRYIACDASRDTPGDTPARQAREALAAYDAQQAGQADAVALIREIALTEACGNSEPDVMARALDGIVGRCEGFIANHAQQPVRIHVFVKLEGGLVQWVGTSSKVPVDVAIIDYDTDGASEDEITAIPQDDGGEADAIARIDTASYDPEFVDRVFAALNTDGCS